MANKNDSMELKLENLRKCYFLNNLCKVNCAIGILRTNIKNVFKLHVIKLMFVQFILKHFNFKYVYENLILKKNNNRIFLLYYIIS